MQKQKYIDAQIIKAELQRLNLKPVAPLSFFKKRGKRFYAVPCFKDKKEKVFLKMLIVKDKKAELKLKKEALITKLLTNLHQKNQELNLPLFLEENFKHIPFWYTHQYLSGRVLGHFYEMGKSAFKKGVKQEIIKILLSLQNIPPSQYKTAFENFPLEKIGFSHYLEKTKKAEKRLKDKYPFDFKTIYRFLEERREYFSKSKTVLSHGDFTLANFFLHRNKIYLTDWEHIHLNNFAYDIAHLWIQTWRYPKWRREILLTFLNSLSKNDQRIFREIFRAIIITEAMGEIIMGLNISPKHKLKARKKNIETVPLALKGFNPLIEVR